MGTIVIGSIIDRARRTLLELKVGQESASDKRWDRVLELLPLANAAIRQIAAHRPSAFTKNVVLPLAAGVKQTLPADAVQLADAQHNMGDDGETPGRAITLIDRAALTAIDPRWMAATGNEIEHYVYDQRDPKTFYPYPRPPDPWYVSVAYHAVPPAIAAGSIDSGAIPIDDTYDSAIHDFIVGYAVLKNFRAGDYQKAAFYLTRFEQATGVQLQRSQEFMPLDQPAALMAPNALGKA